MMKIFVKFEVDTTTCCLVISFLMLTGYVTLWPLTFWNQSLVVH